jgi:hypothetical protein
MSKKIEAFWVDATSDDVARVMKGETVEARFRDDDKAKWFISNLAGWTAGMIQWYSTDDDFWTQCQVYREPSYWTNKPDPGPGWRLLHPDERVEKGDEYYSSLNNMWLLSGSPDTCGCKQANFPYRRRIEPVEPKFAVGQTVRVVGPKVRPAMHWGKEMEPHIGFAGVIRNIPSIEIEGAFYNLEGIGIWCFREDYLEPVEPGPQHYVLRVGDSCETPCGNRITVMPQGSTQRFLNVKAGDTIETIHGQTITITEKGFEVTQ